MDARRALPVPPQAEVSLKAVLDAAFEVHTDIGPGCLERVYQTCLMDLLRQREHAVEAQVFLPVHFRGRRIEGGFRLDLLVDGHVVVEVKALDMLLPVHMAQLLTYLRLSHRPLGLLLNFGEAHLRDGLHRLVHPDYATATDDQP